MNSHRQVVLVTIVVLVALALSQPCAQQVNAQDLRMPGLRVKRSMLYPLQPGQPVFADREFVWQEISAELERHLAVCNQLEGLEPLEVAVKGPGRLLALLWVWDFGFMGDGPPEASNINGWQLLDPQAAHVEGYPWPLGLYARQMPAGRVTVDLKDYMGQWIIVGFERELPAVQDAGRTLALALAGAKTGHNILNPDPEATLQRAPGEKVDDSAGVICELFDEGKRLARFEGTGHALSNEGINFALPERPGRYWLQVSIKGTSTKTVLPLTVALPPIQDYASMEGFFPVGAWVAISGTPEGSFSPDGKLTGELTTIDQVELGVNTFWAAKDAPFIEALNGRKILSARSGYINTTVAAEDPEPSRQKTRKGQPA